MSALKWAALMLFGGMLNQISVQEVDTLRIQVHGHEIVLYASGAGPTVVLEAGGGSSSRVWDAVVPELAKHARVVTYDRPGYGLSEPCDSTRTAGRIATELEAALVGAAVDGPYLVVGWSYGGAIARVLAGAFPSQVTGLVLVDPAPEDFYARAAREEPEAYTKEEEAYFPSLFTDSTRRAEQKELAGYAASMEQARASDARHQKPTIVLIAGGRNSSAPDPLSAIWMDELKKWTGRRPNAEARVVHDSGHHIARDKPQAVLAAVLQLLRRESAK